jgi:hypothetical protein
MTRREFMARVGSLSVICVGLHGVKSVVPPRRTVQAARPLKYPGTIVPMGDIRMQSKWSG